MERIFASFKDTGASTASYDPSDPDSYKQYVKAMILDSRDYEGSVLAHDRDYAQKYYYGYLPALNPDGSPYTDTQIIEDPTATYEQILGYDQESANRSSYVSTDVRDAVLMMLPSLVRIFAANENPVYLVPRTPQQADMAEQATNYVNYAFWNDNPGFLILYGAFKDALTVKTGFVKWWTDNHREMRRKTFVNVPAMQVKLMLAQNPQARLIEHTDPDPQTQTYAAVTIEFEVSKPLLKIAGCPPEEMRIDRYARSWATSRIVGHERVVPIDELIAMGYERADLMEYLQSQDIQQFTMESQLRNPGRYMSTRVGDGVLYGEWYIKVDGDGDGVPELRYICTMGNEYDIVSDETANRVRFALFSCDPISHTIVGDSLTSYTEDIQRIKTNMMRGVLDSLAESINPKTVINELMVNVDDAMNDDLGAIIRTRGDPSNTVQFATTPFAGQQAMPVIDMLNNMLQRRTGLSDAAKGLDPKALQSSTMIGVEAIINGAQERIELVARVLAETGFKDLFKGIFNEIVENPNQQRTLKINGKWAPYDTGTFDADMDVEVNPSMGKGSDVSRMMTLQQIKQDQMMILQQYGLGNPVVGLQQYLNTVTDMLAIANVKNVGRYFMTPNPQQMQQIAQQPKEPDAMTVAARAQMEKVRADQAAKQGQQNLDAMKLQSDNQFRQAQLQAKTTYEMEKLKIERMKLGAGDGTDPAMEQLGKLGLEMMSRTHDSEMQGQQHSVDLEMQQRDHQLERDKMQADAQAQQTQMLAQLAQAHMKGQQADADRASSDMQAGLQAETARMGAQSKERTAAAGHASAERQTTAKVRARPKEKGK